jgi:curli biogenesis system outer membrane secretion channel CsgG
MSRRTAIRPLVTLVALAALVVPPALAQEGGDGWRPYLEEKKGDKEFPENPKELKDEKWLNIAYTEYSGYKPRIGVVMSEERRSGAQEYSNEWVRLLASMQKNPGAASGGTNNTETQVRQALNSTNRFVMVERTTALDDVLGEQDFGASGRVDQKTSAKIGKVKGADYTVKVELIDANPEKESSSIGAIGGGAGARTLGVGSLGLSGKVAWARLNVRVIRTETSEVVADMTVDGTAKGKGFAIGGGLIKAATKGVAGGAAGYDSKKAASLADALQVAANKAAYYVALQLEDLPWEGSVMKVDGTKVTINAGTNVGLKQGMNLKLLSKGEEMIDPDTNESLGFETSEIGALRIVSVAEKFATCEITTGGQGVKRGDTVRLEKGGR